MQEVPSLANLVAVQLATEFHMCNRHLLALFEFGHPHWIIAVRRYVEFLEHTEVGYAHLSRSSLTLGIRASGAEGIQIQDGCANSDKGKPREMPGRKAKGLNPFEVMIAWLPKSNHLLE